MNGGTSTTTTPASDPTALLSTLLASAPSDKILPSGLGGDVTANAASNVGVTPNPNPKPGAGTPSGTLKDGIFGYGYYDDVAGSFTPAERPGVIPPPPPPPPMDEKPPTDEKPPADEVTPGKVTPKPNPKPGEGSINIEADKRGRELAAFMTAFQAAYQRWNPNFNFTRNPKLAKSLWLPWSGDLGL